MTSPKKYLEGILTRVKAGAERGSLLNIL